MPADRQIDRTITGEGSPAIIQVGLLDGVVLFLPIDAGPILALALLFHVLVVEQITDHILGRALDSLTRRRRFFGHGTGLVARRFRVVRAIVVVSHSSSLSNRADARAPRRRCNGIATFLCSAERQQAQLKSGRGSYFACALTGISTRNCRPFRIKSSWRRYAACAKPLIGSATGSAFADGSLVCTSRRNICWARSKYSARPSGAH